MSNVDFDSFFKPTRRRISSVDERLLSPLRWETYQETPFGVERGSGKVHHPLNFSDDLLGKY
jgi:hypothetical protein